MRPAVYATEVTVAVARGVTIGPLDLTVGHGHWATVIGPNGAGKTTLLRALAGLVPSEGRIELHGRSRHDLSRRDLARTVAFVAQRATLPPGLTVEQYVLLGRAPHVGPLGAEGAQDLAVAADAIDRLGLAALARRRVETLSGGEAQRATLARALAQEPSILLLDEPTSALDIGHQQEVLELLDRQRRDLGLTVVATMHDLTLAAQYGDHLHLVAEGRVVADGPPVQVLTDDHLRRHYRAEVDLVRHRDRVVVVPVRPTPDPHPLEPRP